MFLLVLSLLLIVIGLVPIVYHFIGYWFLLKLLVRTRPRNGAPSTNLCDTPFVSVIISAHNEGKVIGKKIENALTLDYPKDRFEVILVDDWSTDETFKVISEYVSAGKIKYFKPDKHLGKTYAQDGAVSMAKGSLLAFSDGNSFWDRGALASLVKSFADVEVGFAAGKVKFNEVETSQPAGFYYSYWQYEMSVRKMESSILSILTSNGAIYCVRSELYKRTSPLYCHDSTMPPYIVSIGRRAVYCEEAVAYEKSIRSTSSYFRKRVRMSGRAFSADFDREIRSILSKTPLLYRMMHFSHRTLRRLLPLFTLAVLIGTTLQIGFMSFISVVICAAILLLIMIISSGARNLFFIYILTIAAEIVGFCKYITGGIKPYWDPIDEAR
ncbi:MAG TPA: hypothetical protein DCE14_07890 [Kosmotogaceae bacterium]|nr:hypothetical protein [Kosmotogaceae bacterium]